MEIPILLSEHKARIYLQDMEGNCTGLSMKKQHFIYGR